MVQAQSTVATSVIPVQAGATYMISVTIRVGFGTISLKSESLKSEAIADVAIASKYSDEVLEAGF